MADTDLDKYEKVLDDFDSKVLEKALSDGHAEKAGFMKLMGETSRLTEVLWCHVYMLKQLLRRVAKMEDRKKFVDFYTNFQELLLRVENSKRIGIVLVEQEMWFCHCCRNVCSTDSRCCAHSRPARERVRTRYSWFFPWATQLSKSFSSTEKRYLLSLDDSFEFLKSVDLEEFNDKHKHKNCISKFLYYKRTFLTPITEPIGK